MTLFFPLIKSYNDNIELRYALRSMQMLQPDRVIVIGHRPKWLINVEHYPFVDTPGIAYKERNIYNKLKAALDIAGEVLFCNDDHFILPGFNPYLNYCQGTIQELHDRLPKGAYKKTVHNTLQILSPSALNYDVHCPMMVKGMPNLTFQPYGYLVKSVIGFANFRLGRRCIDLKITDNSQHALIKDRWFFSVGEAGMTGAFLTLLQQMWPEKSKYEH